MTAVADVFPDLGAVALVGTVFFEGWFGVTAFLAGAGLMGFPEALLGLAAVFPAAFIAGFPVTAFVAVFTDPPVGVFPETGLGDFGKTLLTGLPDTAVDALPEGEFGVLGERGSVFGGGVGVEGLEGVLVLLLLVVDEGLEGLETFSRLKLGLGIG